MDVMDKKRALQLAYQIVTDKRNANRYSFTAITRMDNPELMFTYSDMLNGLRAVFNDLGDALKTQALQKPLTLQELETLIAAGEDVAVYCEAKGDDHAYATILFAGQVVSMNGDKINACDLIFEHYGVTWRAWAQRPTDEEQAAAPWEDAGNADL